MREDTAAAERWPVSTRRLPTALADAGFDGDILFVPAFDHRNRQGGIGGLEVQFWLRGPKDARGDAAGAVSWSLSTGCYLPSTQSEWLSRFAGNTNLPTAGPVVWHSSLPAGDSHRANYDCYLLGCGRACYDDAGFLIGDQAYGALVGGGEEGLWGFLEQMYRSQFDAERATEKREADNGDAA